MNNKKSVKVHRCFLNMFLMGRTEGALENAQNKKEDEMKKREKNITATTCGDRKCRFYGVLFVLFNNIDPSQNIYIRICGSYFLCALKTCLIAKHIYTLMGWMIKSPFG